MAYRRYAYLVQRGLVRNRATLRNCIKAQIFPPGRLLGPNDRAWTDEELAEYEANCPVELKPAPPPPKTPRRHKRERAAVPAATESPKTT